MCDPTEKEILKLPEPLEGSLLLFFVSCCPVVCTTAFSFLGMAPDILFSPR